MKKHFSTTLKSYGAGALAIVSMLAFTACDNDARESDNDTLNDDVEVVTTDMDQASNTDYTAPERNYDVSTMGTAAENRQKTWEKRNADNKAAATQSGTDNTTATANSAMSDEDYQVAWKEYSDVNMKIREALRSNPDVNYRYTDDYKTSDYSYDYYGVYYDNVSNSETAKQMQDLENKRREARNKLRGQMNKETKSYVAADIDAVPKKGFDSLYEFLEDEIEYPADAQAAEIEGTIFVDFSIDANGNVVNPTIGSSIEGQTTPEKGPRNPTQVSSNEREEAIKEMEQEALEAVKKTSGMWDPAMLNSKGVTSEVSLPVRFRIKNM